jgi:hypothetical protein
MTETTAATRADAVESINKPVSTDEVKAEMKLGQKISIESRLRWVKQPSSESTGSVMRWPAVQYESFSELIQDVGEYLVTQLQLISINCHWHLSHLTNFIFHWRRQSKVQGKISFATVQEWT